jgi:hypothetical protein
MHAQWLFKFTVVASRGRKRIPLIPDEILVSLQCRLVQWEYSDIVKLHAVHLSVSANQLTGRQKSNDFGQSDNSFFVV